MERERERERERDRARWMDEWRERERERETDRNSEREAWIQRERERDGEREREREEKELVAVATEPQLALSRASANPQTCSRALVTHSRAVQQLKAL
jgi:hypothetical protein